MLNLTPSKKNRVGKAGEVADFYNMVESFFDNNNLSLNRLENDNFKVDVRENNNEYLVDAELPGYKKEEIQIEFSEEKLSIMVSQKKENDEENEKYIHRERSFTSMRREVYLSKVMENEIKAKFDKGILRITIPKSKEVDKKTKIEIE